MIRGDRQVCLFFFIIFVTILVFRFITSAFFIQQTHTMPIPEFNSAAVAKFVQSLFDVLLLLLFVVEV
jgi:hypothetical protein